MNNFTVNCTNYTSALHLDIRFPLIFVFVVAVSTLGVIGNFFTVIVYTRRSMRSSSHANSAFLVSLAFFDTGVLVFSVCLYSVEVLYDYTHDLQLYRLWLSYVRFVYMLSNWCQVCAVYLTACATVERYVNLRFPEQSQCIYTSRKTLLMIFVIIAIVFGLTITKYWELDVHHQPGCHGFNEYMLSQGILLKNDLYRTVYSVWVSNIIFIFIPFMALLLMNVLIFHKIHQKNPRLQRTPLFAQPWCLRMAERNRKAKSREATTLLLIVVFVFLVCNCPSTVLTAMEHANINFLESHGTFYGFARDVSNLMTVMNSALNCVIYLIFGAQFRKVLYRVVVQFSLRDA